MAPSIPSTTSTSGTNSTTASTSTSSSSSSTNSSTSLGANEDTFLQLLVAELENQDPSNPTDGTEFVTQLAEFQQLTTTMGMATSLTDIQQDTDELASIAVATTNSGSQTGTSSTSGT
jgi:flagellar basal-body rod modification protein FlgD